MSSADRLLMILHIGFAIFALGPVTAATMMSPRYIRRAERRVVRLLNRMTRLFGLLTLGIFLFGLLLADGKFDKAWLTASMTLFIVAFVLLVIVERDQRKALHKLERAEAERRSPPGEAPKAEAAAAKPETEAEKETRHEEPATAGPAPARDLAKVETGRISTIAGIVALIWIVILVLMVWNA